MYRVFFVVKNTAWLTWCWLYERLVPMALEYIIQREEWLCEGINVGLIVVVTSLNGATRYKYLSGIDGKLVAKCIWTPEWQVLQWDGGDVCSKNAKQSTIGFYSSYNFDLLCFAHWLNDGESRRFLRWWSVWLFCFVFTIVNWMRQFSMQSNDWNVWSWTMCDDAKDHVRILFRNIYRGDNNINISPLIHPHWRPLH